MPIYEYECSQCNHKLDVLQSMSEAPLTDCPACGTAHLQKLVSAAGFQLKGTGWYVTDFKDKSNKKETKIDKPASDAVSPSSTNSNAGEKASSTTPTPAPVADAPKKTDTAAN